MTSKLSPSASTTGSELPKESSEPSTTAKEVSSLIDSLKDKVVADRCICIKKRMEENRKKLIATTGNLFKLSMERRGSHISGTNNNANMLAKIQKDALVTKSGTDVSIEDKNAPSCQEDENNGSTVMQGSSVPVKISLRPTKLPEVQKLPPYTTWIFLDRNQRMTEDQSVVGRRRIYYDRSGGEALICSDSEEELIDDEEDKRNFTESEDHILCMTVKELGLSDPVLELLAQSFSRSVSEVKARYEVFLKEEDSTKNGDDEIPTVNSILNKDLEGALDSFDNLFCRRCLVFDCRLHGCSQDLIFPAEKQALWSHNDDENLTCGSSCYKMALKSERTSPELDATKEKTGSLSDGSSVQISSRNLCSSSSTRRKQKSCPTESASSNAKCTPETSDSEIEGCKDNTSSKRELSPKVKLGSRRADRKRNSQQASERVLRRTHKRQKKMISPDSGSVASGCRSSSDIKRASASCKENEDFTSSLKRIGGRSERKTESTFQNSRNAIDDASRVVRSSELSADPNPSCDNDGLRTEEFVGENTCKEELIDDKRWKPIERSLFQKGVEIFGMNSCLIARNLMNGLKTCLEVFQFMTSLENKMLFQGGGAANLEGRPKFDFNGNMVNSQVRRRSRFLRRRGKVRRLKYTWKSAAYHSIRKRITERKDQPCRQFNPCGCQTACSKQCACLLNGTCCEKYCGCPKSCKNRFRGCHCAKSQCRSRQCPCFAADRECDPDVCRNCWISCGDGTLGNPGQRGDNYECRNMKLLLKQQQRVLLGRSDVSGWGAFLKNGVGKHEYLGEYTGELISHKEADKRGKIYDRENSSFLFNLNDQFVLDAYRKGDKLKFANHSPEPNCYAKVIMVAGDHRVGIFAKEKIMAGEELFYDYRYEPDRAPAWAKKPEASGSKKDDAAPSVGRPKKLA